jgi:hypothetical protein
MNSSNFHVVEKHEEEGRGSKMGDNSSEER